MRQITGSQLRGSVKKNSVASGASKRRASGRRAAALVEMAIALPLLCLITLGLMEYGWIFMRISHLNQAARHGVRTAVRPAATNQKVENAVTWMMTEVGLQDSGYVLTYTDVNVPVSDPVTVQINVDYPPMSLTGTTLVPVPNKIQGRATMAKEGP